VKQFRDGGSDIREFGDALINTGDIDPIYIAMVEAKLPPSQLARALLAYWCFYNLGVSAWISEQEDYWHWMKVAAANNTSPRDLGLPSDRWPRGSERRHFRGTKCINAVEWLSRHDPRALVERLAGLETEHAIIARTNGWPMFGPWIGFKIADMMERVWGAPIRFSRNIGLMYDGPRAGLELLGATPSFIAQDRRPEALYGGLLNYFSSRKAPPTYDRACGPQEVETILCKWKSHRGGHYEQGKDTREMRHALQGWGPTAEKMLGQRHQQKRLRLGVHQGGAS
jgi:hypothetical protein